MANHTSTANTAVYYYVPAVIIGLLTAWFVFESFPITILGAILALLTAGLYVNVFVKKGGEA